MYENIKLIVCDIDGTMVPSHNKLSDYGKEMIQKIKEKNILFGIASGRSIKDIKYILSTWGYNQIDFIIGLNGSQLYDGTDDKVYDYFQMKPEWIKETFDIMRPFSHNPVMYFQKAYMCGVYDEKIHFSAQYTKSDYVVAQLEEDFYQEPNAKIMFRVDEKDMPEVERRVKEFESVYYKGNKTQSTLMEFQNRQASKAYALEQFCIKHNIKLIDTMAFGDTTNDNEMIEAAGIGVCMINGSQDTKELADVITEKSVIEDGWADFIDRYI